MKGIGFIAGFVLFVGIWGVVMNLRTPTNLGVEKGCLAPMPLSPNAVSTQTEDPEKHIDPWVYKGSLETAKACVMEAVQRYGNATVVNEQKDYIHVVFKTGLMKFRDDVEFYFDEVDQVIHIRSASRIGYSDMGLNRQRYETLTTFYKQSGNVEK